MAVWYLDNDDEITDAVARLRGADEERVVFVVPPGSRIASGRINFKLLAREAQSRELAMAIASPDEQVRALAAAAGVLAAATPDEAEAALERGDEAVRPEAPAALETGAGANSPGTTSREGRGPLAWRSQRIRLATVLVLAFVLVAGFVIAEVLPTAEITLRPSLSALGPMEGVITASAATETVDTEAGTIPAVVVPIRLSEEVVWPSNGVEAVETHASGEVAFSAPDQEFDQEIGAGTRVQTPSGIAFQTTAGVTLSPNQDGSPAQVIAPVEALESGGAGNVLAETISIAPSLESQGISVSNSEAMSGGRFEESPLLLAADYDAAAADLKNRLGGQLDAYLRDPANTPEGLTLFAVTALLGSVDLQPAADELVGDVAAEFALAGGAAARVLAVDEQLIDEISRARLLAALPEGQTLVASSMDMTHGEGSVQGDEITFTTSSGAQVTPDIDTDELLARIAGLPVSEAQAILEGLGTASVTVWPGFLGDLPNDRQRITLDVVEASATE
jgi:hypothetical protein